MGDAGGDDDWYEYCLDDPVNGFDPLGLFALGGAGLTTAAMGVTGLIQHAPQINQWGIAIANDLMDGSYGFFDLTEDVGSYALDAIKAYPDVVFENTKHKRERLAKRATRYRQLQEEKRKRARARREEDAAEEKAREAEKSKTRSPWGDDGRDSLDGTSGNKGGSVMSRSSRNAWGDDGRDSLDGTSGNKGQSVASRGGGWW